MAWRTFYAPIQLNKFKMNNKIYVVCYDQGSYEDHVELIIFATSDLKKANRYRLRFNSIHKRWKRHYKQYYPGQFKMWREEDMKCYLRWWKLNNIGGCYIKEVEVR